MGNGLLNQSLAVKFHGVGVLVTDAVPEGLELLAVETVVQWVFPDLGFEAVPNHIVQDPFIKDVLHQRVDARRDFRTALRQRRQCAFGQSRAVCFAYTVVVVNVVVSDQVAVNIPSLPFRNSPFAAVYHKGLSNEILRDGLDRALVKVLSDTPLQVCHKLLVAVRGNHRQPVYLLHLNPQRIRVHTDTALVHAQAEAAAHLLPLLRRGISAVLQGADLKYIGIVPALPQGRVREDEAHRILKGQQPLLVLQNQVVGGDVVAFITAAFEGAVHLPAFFVDAEISGVGPVSLDALEVLRIRCAAKGQILVQNVGVFPLEDLAVFGVDLLTVGIVPAVLCHFVNEKQREGFDAPAEELLFLLEVGANRLPNLHPAQVRLRHVPGHFAGADHRAVGEGEGSPNRIHVADAKASILLHVL